jgi:hypothetical protein
MTSVLCPCRRYRRVANNRPRQMCASTLMTISAAILVGGLDGGGHLAVRAVEDCSFSP